MNIIRAIKHAQNAIARKLTGPSLSKTCEKTEACLVSGELEREWWVYIFQFIIQVAIKWTKNTGLAAKAQLNLEGVLFKSLGWKCNVQTLLNTIEKNILATHLSYYQG